MKSNRKIFDELIKNFEIPVYEVSYKEYFKIIKEKKEKLYCSLNELYADKYSGRIGGIFHPSYYKGSPFIFVYKYQEIDAKIWIILHEYGHYLCYRNHCSCVYNNTKNEYHAIRYSLKTCLENKFLSALFNYIEDIENSIENLPENEFHNKCYNKVYKRIMKLKLWGKCMKLLKKNGYKLKDLK